MKLSARNVLPGTVLRVVRGAVNAEIELALTGGETIVAVITNESADRLALEANVAACAIIKASEVMIGTHLESARISARNVLTGTVSAIRKGAVNSEVQVALAGGSEIVASITQASVTYLGIEIGDAVSAIIKASNVLIGV